MKKVMISILIVGAALVFQAQPAHAAQAASVRATDLTNDLIHEAMSGEISDLTVEFRKGDRVPVVFSAQGDFLESVETVPSYWIVRREFYLKLEQKQVLMSLDGKTYKPINQLVTGSLSAGAEADSDNPIANVIHVSFKAYLK